MQIRLEAARPRTSFVRQEPDSGDLNIDDEALAHAMKVSAGKTKTDVINEALREYARREELKGLLAWHGKAPWQGSLDELRKRG